MKINELIETKTNGIFKKTLYIKNENCEDVEVGSVTIMCGGFNSENPKYVMDNIVREYTGSKEYNDFVEIFLDNPYVRVIIEGINELDYEEFINQNL